MGALWLVCTLFIAISGLTPIVFRSDSMSPAISSGDLAMARSVSAGDIAVGDIVSVDNRAGNRITHRVELVEPYGSSIRLTLRADANAAPDAETYEVTTVDKVIVNLPQFGRIVGPATTPVGLAVGGVFVACLAFVIVTPQRRARGTRKANGGGADTES